MKNIISAVLTIFVLSGQALAQDNTPQDAALARQALMAYMGAHMKPLAKIAKGQADFNQQFVTTSAQSFAAIATAYTKLFPEGSDTGVKTAVNPVVFSDRSGLVAAASAMKAAAETLAGTSSADTLKPAFIALNNACGACHEKYRKRK